MLATSSSEATSSSAAITRRTILTAPVTSRILFASSRLSPIGGSIAELIGVGLPDGVGRQQRRAHGLEVVGVVELEVERRRQRVLS